MSIMLLRGYTLYVLCDSDWNISFHLWLKYHFIHFLLTGTWSLLEIRCEIAYSCLEDAATVNKHSTKLYCNRKNVSKINDTYKKKERTTRTKILRNVVGFEVTNPVKKLSHLIVRNRLRSLRLHIKENLRYVRSECMSSHRRAWLRYIRISTTMNQFVRGFFFRSSTDFTTDQLL